MQGDDRYFWPGTKSERQANKADAHIDVQSSCAFLIHASPFVIYPCSRRPAKERELCGVGVTSQHEVYVGFWQYFPAPVGGVVAQQDAEHPLCAL